MQETNLRKTDFSNSNAQKKKSTVSTLTILIALCFPDKGEGHFCTQDSDYSSSVA